MNTPLPLSKTLLHKSFASASSHTAANRSRRVLVVDDDTLTRGIMALFMEESGYLVDTAEDGEQGWDALCSTPYDLLVTDNDMPRLTGTQLVARLRAVGLTLPVILASGSMDWEMDDCPQLGLAAVLQKPYAFSDLLSAALRIAPLAANTGKGSVDCLTLQRSKSVHFPFPTRFRKSSLPSNCLTTKSLSST